MKKISAVLLSMLFIISAFAPNVLAADFSQENITVNVVGYKVKVTVTTDVDGRMLAYLMNEAKSETYGLDYDAEPSEVNGIYTYTFNFKVKKTVPTSKLIVRVGNNVPSTEKVINYANINDKNSFLNGLEDVTDALLVDEYLDTNQEYTSADVAAYLSLPENIRTLVSANIVDLDLATGYENMENETDEYISEKVAAVSEKETLFNDEFAKSMKCAKIMAATQENWNTLAESAIAEGLFDAKFYTATEDAPALMTISNVYSFFVKEAEAMEKLSEEELSKAFDRATLMEMEDGYEYGTLKSGFLYFVKSKGTIVASDTTKIDQLVAADKDTELWRSIKTGTYTDCADLVAKIVAKAAELAGNGAEGDETAGNENINNPTSPGGFTGGGMGGGTTKPTTPQDPTPVVPEGTFSDIANVEWAKESIEALAEMGVLSGKGDGKFAPDDSVTREEFVKIIVAAFELEDTDAECDFVDVSKDSWSYSFIASANKLGIVSGDGASFNPKSGISRQDMAVIIHRVFEYLGAEIKGDAIAFDDNSEISDYAKSAVEALTAAGIINGMGDGTFAPAGKVTRAQAAKVVYGLLSIIGGGK